MSNQYAIMQGDPLGGYWFIGPFDDAVDAEHHACKYCDAPWYIIHLEPPLFAAPKEPGGQAINIIEEEVGAGAPDPEWLLEHAPIIEAINHELLNEEVAVPDV